MSEHEDRHSIADPLELIADPEERAKREAENGLRQYQAAQRVILDALAGEKPFRLRQALILDSNLKAREGIHPLAGTYRNTFVIIHQSKHIPPNHVEVADHVSDMCDYINDNWNDRNAIFLSAYVMWRMNWIHPFADGNGRTARVISYIVLSVKLKSLLPGSPTIPELISQNKQPYYAALETADYMWKKEEIISLVEMENILEQALEQQLRAATEQAGR